MTRMVQVAVAGGASEAEEIQAMLAEVGIESELAIAVEHHPQETEDAPQKVLVPESMLEQAMEAIEAMSEPDELDGEP